MLPSAAALPDERFERPSWQVLSPSSFPRMLLHSLPLVLFRLASWEWHPADF